MSKEDFEIEDHGKREEMGSGSVRDTQAGKPRPGLIPPSTLMKIAMHDGKGAEKYDSWNWSKGQPISRYMESLGRHYLDFCAGFTNEPHLIAMIWNAISIDYTLDAIECGILPKELDDRHECQKEGNLLGQLMLERIEASISRALEKQEEKEVKVDVPVKDKLYQEKPLTTEELQEKAYNNLKDIEPEAESFIVDNNRKFIVYARVNGNNIFFDGFAFSQDISESKVFDNKPEADHGILQIKRHGLNPSKEDLLVAQIDDCSVVDLITGDLIDYIKEDENAIYTVGNIWEKRNVEELSTAIATGNLATIKTEDVSEEIDLDSILFSSEKLYFIALVPSKESKDRKKIFFNFSNYEEDITSPLFCNKVNMDCVLKSKNERNAYFEIVKNMVSGIDIKFGYVYNNKIYIEEEKMMSLQKNLDVMKKWLEGE